MLICWIACECVRYVVCEGPLVSGLQKLSKEFHKEARCLGMEIKFSTSNIRDSVRTSQSTI